MFTHRSTRKDSDQILSYRTFFFFSSSRQHKVSTNKRKQKVVQNADECGRIAEEHQELGTQLFGCSGE
jgi:hypothetical protein